MKITRSSIKSLQTPTEGNKKTYWDEGLNGFGIAVYKTGTIKYLFRYRSPTHLNTKGHGKQRVLTLATFIDEPMHFQDIKEQVYKFKAMLDKGVDPQDHMQEVKTKKINDDAKEAILTVNNMWEKYINSHAATENRSSTIDDKNRVYKLHAQKEIGHLHVKYIDKADIQSLIVKVREKTPAQAKKLLAYLKSAFNEAKAWKGVWQAAIDTNPCVGIKIPSTNARMRYLSEEELKTLLEELEALITKDELLKEKSIQYAGTKRAFIPVYSVTAWVAYFILLTGCRPAEARQAKKEHFNLDLQKWYIPIENMKSKQQTIKPLNKKAVSLIKRLSKLSTSPYLFPADHRQGDPNDHVKRIDISFKRLVTRLELSDITPHDLRRTYACQLLLNGVDIFSVSKLLGHSDVNLTAKHYAFLNLHSLEKANDVLDSVLDNLTSPKAKVA